MWRHPPPADHEAVECEEAHMSANLTEDDFGARGAWIDFLSVFAGVLMIIGASFEMLQGAAAIADPDFFAAGSEYLYRFNVTAWGWIHLTIGVLSAIVAIGLFTRKSWSYLAGLVIVGLGMLANFAAVPHYPAWALTVIAIDVAIIWALSQQLARQQ